jgi:hypothetical protein
MLAPKLFSGDDHEPGLRNFASELGSLLIFPPVGLRPGRAEDGDLANASIRREKPEGVAHLAQGSLDDTHVAGVLYIGQQLERVGDDVGDFGFVMAAALESDEFPNPFFQFWVNGGFSAGPSIHGGKIALRRLKATAGLEGIQALGLRRRARAAGSRLYRHAGSAPQRHGSGHPACQCVRLPVPKVFAAGRRFGAGAGSGHVFAH